jgi:hypothetical protein
MNERNAEIVMQYPWSKEPTPEQDEEARHWADMAAWENWLDAQDPHFTSPDTFPTSITDSLDTCQLITLYSAMKSLVESVRKEAKP